MRNSQLKATSQASEKRHNDVSLTNPSVSCASRKLPAERKGANYFDSPYVCVKEIDNKCCGIDITGLLNSFLSACSPLKRSEERSSYTETKPRRLLEAIINQDAHQQLCVLHAALPSI